MEDFVGNKNMCIVITLYISTVYCTVSAQGEPSLRKNNILEQKKFESVRFFLIQKICGKI